jgi:hypothetical protein
MPAKLLSYAEKQIPPVVASVHFTGAGDAIEQMAVREGRLAW